MDSKLVASEKIKLGKKFKFAWRKRIFAIFLFSSLSAIIIQIPSLQTDLLVGSLLICAFALFIRNSIYFSSISLAVPFFATYNFPLFESFTFPTNA